MPSLPNVRLRSSTAGHYKTPSLFASSFCRTLHKSFLLPIILLCIICQLVTVEFVGSEQLSSSPLIIAHRGASCCRPEHSISAYDLAIHCGADFIEQDVVVSKDGELIVLHDRELDATTNAAQFPFLPKATKPALDKTSLNDTTPEQDYFVEDLTLEQLKKLRVKQRFDFREQSYNNLFPIHTLREVFQYSEAKHKEKRLLNTHVGLYIELKNPHFFRSIGLPMEEKFLQLLVEFGFILKNDDNHHVTADDHQQKKSTCSDSQSSPYQVNPEKPLIIQCFESTTLKFFKEKIEGIFTVQLIKKNFNILQQDNEPHRYGDMVTDEGLKHIATYADGIGPHKSAIMKFEGAERKSSGLVKRAHDHGLVVHPYTFRSDYPAYFKKEEWGMSNAQEEVVAFFEEGIDGLFTDWPKDAFEARDTYYSTLVASSPSPPFSARLVPWSLTGMTLTIVVAMMAYLTYTLKYNREREKKM